jgi:3-oxoacyl-[acyl-carrier protein] reductase
VIVNIITGTRKGIGKELALHFLDKGQNIVGCSRGEATIDHENYEHYCLDVTDEKAVTEMVRSTKRKYSTIDILLNNAGIAAMNHIVTTPVTTARNVFETNFIGSFLFLREVSKVMMRRKNGRIVNFSTVAVGLRLEGEAVYGASKAAIANLTQVAAKELGSFGITVNAVAPTPVETDLIKAVPRIKINELLEQQAVKRFGEFRDVINVVDFFVSPESDFVTGQVIYLGGING